MQIERIQSDGLVVNQLPDGSKVLVDVGKETVFALNATAGAAWEACSSPTTLSDVTAAMQKKVGAEVTEEVAEAAILELEEKHLVKTSAPVNRSRRAFLGGAAAAAVPLVLAMTMGEQKAYAHMSGSGMYDHHHHNNNGNPGQQWPPRP